MRLYNQSMARALLLAGTMVVAAAANAELAVVVHPDNAISSITEEEVARIYLGKSRSFPGGGSVMAVDQIAGADIRTEFYQKVVKKQESRLKAYWARLMFTGKARPPKSIGDDYEVRAFIAENKDAIGYIDMKSVDRSVKVLLIVP